MADTLPAVPEPPYLDNTPPPHRARVAVEMIRLSDLAATYRAKGLPVPRAVAQGLADAVWCWDARYSARARRYARSWVDTPGDRPVRTLGADRV